MYPLQPSEPAYAYLELIWEWEGYVSTAPAERILPHGKVEVSWNLRAPHRFRTGASASSVTAISGAALIGARDSAYHVDTALREQPFNAEARYRRPDRAESVPTHAEAHLFGLVFRPGSVSSLLGLSMGELTGSMVALADFRFGSELEHRVAEAGSAEMRRRVVLETLGRRARPRRRESEVLLRAWQSAEGRQTSVQSIRSALGLSAPTFVRRVQEQLGLRPAQLRQILMFEDAVKGLAAGRASFTEVAHAVGYCDQAHLNRAFRRHAGLVPSRFRPLMPDHPFNVPELEPITFEPRTDSFLAHRRRSGSAKEGQSHARDRPCRA